MLGGERKLGGMGFGGEGYGGGFVGFGRKAGGEERGRKREVCIGLIFSRLIYLWVGWGVQESSQHCFRS